MPQSAVFYRSYRNVRDMPSDSRAQIAFAGRSNVGKSALLNKLANRKRLAHTSKTPGRTRDINFYLIDDSYYFVDLPGYGFAKVSRAEKNRWNRVVEEYFREKRSLKGLILLIDSRREPGEDDVMMMDWGDANRIPMTVALTKADKLGRGDLAKKIRYYREDYGLSPIPFSVLSGLGKKELIQWIENVIRN